MSGLHYLRPPSKVTLNDRMYKYPSLWWVSFVMLVYAPVEQSLVRWTPECPQGSFWHFPLCPSMEFSRSVQPGRCVGSLAGCTNVQYRTFRSPLRTEWSGLALSGWRAGTFASRRCTVLSFPSLDAPGSSLLFDVARFTFSFR